MESIPSSICLTAYSGGVTEFMQTPLQELVSQIEAGTLPISVGRTFTIAQIVEAHAVMEANTAGGKVVVLP